MAGAVVDGKAKELKTGKSMLMARNGKSMLIKGRLAMSQWLKWPKHACLIGRYVIRRFLYKAERTQSAGQMKRQLRVQ